MGLVNCRPLGFLLSLPFAFIALLISLIGAIIWLLGLILNAVCPCCCCCAWIANVAMDFIQLPISVIQWFIDLIPC